MMSTDLFIILDFVAFALMLLGNVATVVLAGVVVLFAFKGIKVRE